MTQKDFHNILNYLRCHPSDTLKLATIISESLSMQADTESGCESLSAIKNESQWISAREAGSLIGKSSTWVRRMLREGLFGSTRQTGRGDYKFLREEVLADYNSYVMSRTKCITINSKVNGIYRSVS